MEAKIGYLLVFLGPLENALTNKRERGAPKHYSNSGFLLFFIVMALKRIHAFKKMHTYMQSNYKTFGFSSAPSRKTIRLRFKAMPIFIAALMPKIAESCLGHRPALFRFDLAFVDKSVFRALGGIWHKKHMVLGVVPHPSIDPDASWAKSPYHGWRFGYGLHLVCNAARFPLSAHVTTAAVKDYHVLDKLFDPLKHLVGIAFGDAGYTATRYLKKLFLSTQILLLTKEKCLKTQDQFAKLYNSMRSTVHAALGYKQRKPSIEPLFALIKDLFSLTKELQLPYKGIDKVNSYLMILSVSVQLLMIYNHDHKLCLQDTSAFVCSLR
jgi:hypothetical protein